MARRPRARWSRAASAALLLAAVLPCVVVAGPSAAPPGSGEPPVGGGGADPMPLYLDVVLKQVRHPQLLEFVLHADGLHASGQALRSLGFDLPGHADAATVPLASIPGVVVVYDAARQRVEITAPLDTLALATSRLGRRGVPDAPVVTDRSPGIVANYSLHATHGGGSDAVSATTELRTFGLGRGVFSTTSAMHARREAGHGWRGESVRLDSSWELSFPERAISVTLGDTYTGFLDWGRPVRIGGIQVGRNYALQPYRITTPLPEFLGEAVVPSDVELYVNGMRQYSGSTPAGPFQLSTVPGMTGAGNARLVVTDAFGQVRSLDLPFYSTTRLLAGGLTDWSASLGVVRDGYGVRSFDYGDGPVASATFRHGASNRLTLEGHAEGGAGLVNAGAGAAWQPGLAGVFEASHARSELDGLRGSQSTLGYGWNNRYFNVSLESRRTRGDYRDVASLQGAPPPSRSERALLGATSPRLGNLSLSYARLEYPGDDAAPARYAGLYWSRSFRTWHASLSLNRNLDDHGDHSAYLGISIPLGRQSLAMSLQRDRGGHQAVADLSRPVPADGGLGWRLQARGGDGETGGLAEFGWIGEHARLGGGIASLGGDGRAYASASGSLVRMGGSSFAAREIDDAFAVVTTDGLAGVPVKLENRVVGTTDARGKLLVTRLNAWQHNKLSIDPMDLPADVRVTRVDQVAVPADRSGSHVHFAATPVRAALVQLVDDAGRPLPLGGRVAVDGSAGPPAIVGHDGETYLEGLDARVRLRVQLPGAAGSCTAAFDYPAAGGPTRGIDPPAAG